MLGLMTDVFSQAVAALGHSKPSKCKQSRNSLNVGCRKYSNVNRFYDRTAGVMALVRPCGIIANFTEMYTCESTTQAYIFIYTTFGRSVSDLERLKFLGYDRSCDLHPFLCNLKKKGSLGATILLEHVKFMVDLTTLNYLFFLMFME